MKTKLAVIGTGNVGILHGNAASTLENVELVAGIDVIPGSLKKFTDQFGVPGFASVTEMLKHVKPDVVTIGTPQHYRLDPVRTSLENGIHVLAEKPLAANSLEGRQMVQKADQCGLVLGIVSQRAFYPSLQRLKRLFDSGDFEVLSGTGQGFGHRDEAYYQGASGFRGKRGDGAMLNQYAHYMANLVFLLGAFESVSAEMANLNHPYIEAEDWASGLFRFKSGVRFTWTATNNVSAQKAQRGWINFVGRDGNVVGAQLDAEMFVAGGPPPSTAPFNHIWTPESDEQVAQWKADDEEFVRQAGRIDVFYHARQIENFVAATKGEAELLTPGSLGLEALEATIAMIISSETGRRVNLPLSDDDIQLYTRWLRGETIDPAVWPTGVTESYAHG